MTSAEPGTTRGRSPDPSSTRYDRRDHGSTLVGWSYCYRGQRKRREGELSTGLEIAVQLSGEWGLSTRRTGCRSYGPGSIFTIHPSEGYGDSFEGVKSPIRQVGFIVYPKDLACDDRELSVAQGVILDRGFVRFCRDYHDALERGQSLSDGEVMGSVHAFVNRHGELRPKDRVEPHAQPKGGIGHARSIATGRAFIERHADRPLYLAHIADAVGMHQRTFSRAFTATYGIGPIHYRLLLRLNVAAHLTWSAPHMTTAEIAVTAGFDDLAYFHREFLRRFGSTPVQYAARDR